MSDKLTGKAAHASTDDERIAVARAIHDGPSAVLELATMLIAPHGFDECAHKATYLADADAVLAAGFRRSEAPEPRGRKPICAVCGVPFHLIQHDEGCLESQPQGELSSEKLDWPDHWTTNEKLRDLHARWHDQPGNLIESCGWEGCEFWEVAKFTLRMADVRVIGREAQGELSDAQDATSIALRDWERVGSGCDPLTAGDRLYVALAALRAAGGVR